MSESNLNRITWTLFFLFLVIMFSGCTGMGPKSVNMVPDIRPSSSKIGGNVFVAEVTGGMTQHSFMTAGHSVKQTDFQSAIIITLEKSYIFDQIQRSDGARFRFETEIQDQLSFPDRGLGAINCLSTRYALVEKDGSKEIWSVVVTSRSRHDLIGMGAEFVNALENNTKKNIEMMVYRLESSGRLNKKSAAIESFRETTGRSVSLADFDREDFDLEVFLDGMTRLSINEDIYYWKDPSAKLKGYRHIIVEPIGTRLIEEEEKPDPEFHDHFNDLFGKYMGADGSMNFDRALCIRSELIAIGPGNRFLRLVSPFGGGPKVIVAVEVFTPQSNRPVAVVYDYGPWYPGSIYNSEVDVVAVKADLKNIAMNISAVLMEILLDMQTMSQ